MYGGLYGAQTQIQMHGRLMMYVQWLSMVVAFDGGGPDRLFVWSDLVAALSVILVPLLLFLSS